MLQLQCPLNINITTGMPDLMDSFGKDIFGSNKEILSVGTDILARGEDPSNLLPQIFATYDDFS